MIMRLRHANIRLIDRRSNLPRLPLALFSKDGKSNDNDKNNPTDSRELIGSLHIRSLTACLPPLRQEQKIRRKDRAPALVQQQAVRGLAGFTSRQEPDRPSALTSSSYFVCCRPSNSSRCSRASSALS
jgi:hypothetical protein